MGPFPDKEADAVIKNRLLASIAIVALSIIPAGYAAAGGSSFSVGVSFGSHHGGYGHSGGHRSYGSHRSGGHRSYGSHRGYRSHSYSSHRNRHSYSRSHRSYGYRSHSSYRTPNYRYRYRYENHHGQRSYRYYSRPGYRSYGHSKSHRRSYGHGGYRSYSTPRYYRRSSDYYPRSSYYSYAPVGYVSSSYCPTYGSSYNYGSGSYRNYSYRKYSGVNTYYGGGYRGSYPAPIIVNPITPDRSHTYDQSKPSIEDYRQWQREGDQSPDGREYENGDQGTSMTARDRVQMVEAWEFIGADEPRRALSQFAGLCESNPNSAVMKAGYAVSAAMSGDDRTAYWAMRRAVTVGGGMIGYLPAAEGLSTRLEELAGAIQGQIDAQGASSDRMFLLAGVQMLQHDNAAALASAEEAYRLGDRHQTITQMLKHLRSQSSVAYEPSVTAQ